METAVTVLLWLVAGAIAIWILSAVVGLLFFRSVSKKIDRDFNDFRSDSHSRIQRRRATRNNDWRRF